MRNVSRREFLGTAAWAAASAVCPGFGLAATAKPRLGRPAVQLYSLTAYIGGKRNPKTRQFDMSGVGLARALADVKTIGYEGVEFAGYWGKSAKEIAQMLKDNGLEVCGTHVSRGNLSPDWIRKTLDFNLEYGNTHVICPGSGMWPDAKWDKGNDAWWKQIVEFYAQAAETARTYGCTIGYHNVLAVASDFADRHSLALEKKEK